MTSNDRHASHDSPYRTGQHVPLPQNRHTPLTVNSPGGLESRADLNSTTYDHDLEAGHGFTNSGAGSSSPKSPVVRTSLQRANTGGMENLESGEIQMQSFSDGLPPPPPVSHSWKRMDRWLEDNYEELWENLGEPATFNDVNELEHELDCTLPQEVRESIQIHDGQERGGMPTGVLFGCMLLDCEEIIQEWQQWRTVNEAYLSNQREYEIPQAPLKAFAGSSSSAAVPVAQPSSSPNPHWRQELLDKQDSQPANAIQKAYSHPAWIPMARDWGGNNIAVDLAPGPTGKWGQVILMGRDYDCKYVISRSWSAFLATVADDMATDKWFIDEESKELKLREFKQPGVEPAYIDIIRWRADQKYGRKGPKRRQPLRINSQVAEGMNGFSPYGSPTSANEDRGRSPQRFSGNGKAPATSSPRAHISSPLARVTEEPNASGPHGLKIDTGLSSPPSSKSEKLVSIDTPLPPPTPKEGDEKRDSFPKTRLSTTMSADDENTTPTQSTNQKKVDELAAGGGAEDEMRDIAL